MTGVCKVFSYVMVEEAPAYKNLLWTCEGQVMFQSSAVTTDWHGTFREIHNGVVQIKFHYPGKKSRLRTTNVVEVSPGVWMGRDYRCRKIEMRLIETLEYSPVNGWALVDGTP